ncbi:MAG: nucleotidyltransferase domain-containing protein [Acetobacteraceae bacterium]|jgi:predicted nucleotidyltransferase
MSEQAMHTRVCSSADDVIAILRAHEPELRAAGVKSLWLFGPIARGESDPDGDVDLAVTLDPVSHIGLIGLSSLERRIGNLIGRTVELVPEPVETPHLRASIERDRKFAF